MGFRGFGRSVYTRRNPWARKIDYDKEIAGDEATIAQCTQALAKRWLKPDAWADYGTRAVDMVVYNAARPVGIDPALVEAFAPEAFGLTREEVSCMAYYVDAGHGQNEALGALIDETDGQTQRYARGVAAFRKVEGMVGDLNTEARLREDLRLAKAALSRHKRNKAKFGGAS